MFKMLDTINCESCCYELRLIIDDENFLTMPSDALDELNNVGAEFDFAESFHADDPEEDSYLIMGTLRTTDIFETLMELEDCDWVLPTVGCACCGKSLDKTE
ncbi:MAG: hypothetical protein M0R80_04270 [Proteobacteria bacterium]|jgi:hypothetical protein|nr:hypothetical protein [Pseudomonadota bacterium]